MDEIRRAASALDEVDLHAQLDLDELYEMGDLLQVIIDRLCTASSYRLTQDLKALRDRPLYDDSQVDATFASSGVVEPAGRLVRAQEEVKGLRDCLMKAYRHASEYHNAIGHIGIRRTP